MWPLFDAIALEHLRVWFAPEDLKSGSMADSQIEEAIRVYDKLLLIISEHSLHSKGVMAQLRKARKAELANNQRKLFPIRLADKEVLDDWEFFDPETSQDLASEVRRYVIPDFTSWKDHDSFEFAFAKLLEGLKAVDAPPAPRAAPQTAPQVQPPTDTIIVTKQRRLRLLKEQAAREGHNTPPEIIMEIEDLRRELEG